MVKTKYLGMLLSFIIFASVLHASSDKNQNMRPAVWRSSQTNAQCNMLMIASGTIHFHGVVIGSFTVNNGGDSRVSFFNSTSPATALANFNVSTATLLGTGSTTGTSGPEFVPFDMSFSSGMVIDKKGLADVTILWDYVLPKTESLVPYRP